MGQFLKKAESKMDFNLTYTDDLVDLNQPNEVVGNSKSFSDVLAVVSMQTNLNFVKVNEKIHLKDKTGNLEDKAVKVILQADIIIKGVVNDKSGAPFPGVTVLVKGTSIGAATDLDGKYTLTVPEGATLVFSFVGFTTQEFVVGNQSTINVTLAEDETALSEVIVIGYGTQLPKNLSAAERGTLSITAEDAKAYAIMDLRRQRAELVNYGWFNALSTDRQNGIAQLAYTMGVDGVLKFHKMIKALEAGDDAKVGAEIRNSVWYKQVKPTRGEFVIRQLQGN